jgi:DNA-binding transcriptional ArsR family regulator
MCTMPHMRGASIGVKDGTRLLETLAEPTRFRLHRLMLQQELSVCDLVDALRVPQYKVSRHPRGLRAVGLMHGRRNGRWMHYRIAFPVAASTLPLAHGSWGVAPRICSGIGPRGIRKSYGNRSGSLIQRRLHHHEDSEDSPRELMNVKGGA